MPFTLRTASGDVVPLTSTEGLLMTLSSSGVSTWSVSCSGTVGVAVGAGADVAVGVAVGSGASAVGVGVDVGCIVGCDVAVGVAVGLVQPAASRSAMDRPTSAFANSERRPNRVVKKCRSVMESFHIPSSIRTILPDA